MWWTRIADREVVSYGLAYVVADAATPIVSPLRSGHRIPAGASLTFPCDRLLKSREDRAIKRCITVSLRNVSL